jgi:DNA-binding transcriptional LysR family regulator
MEEAALAIDLKLYGRDACLKGKLVLTVEAVFANTMIIPHLAGFTTRYPEIDLEVITDSSLTDMNMREADIAVRITPSPPEDLVGRKICELGHGIYASKRYLAAFTEREQKHKQSLLQSPDAGQAPQMRGHCLVLWTGDDESLPWVKDNFSNTRTAAKFSSPGSILKAVKSHMGIARVPCGLAELDPDLVRLPAKLAPSTWNIWILSRPELRTTERVRVFRNFLFDILNQQKDLLQGNV